MNTAIAAIPLDQIKFDTYPLAFGAHADPDAGVTNVTLFFRSGDHERQLREMRTVGDDVVPTCR